MFKKIYFCFLLALIFLQQSFASKAPTLPISYDSCGITAKSFAMGETGVASPCNIDGIYYNSASIGFNQTEQIQVEMLVSVARKTQLQENYIFKNDPIDLGFQSIALLQKSGAISWRTLSSHEVEFKDGLNYYKKQESIKAITISAANFNQKNYSVGINLSYLYGTLSESSLISSVPFAQTSSGNGFSLDLGYLQQLSNNLYFGINLENIIGFMWWEKYDYDQLPFGIRTGLSYIYKYFTIMADWNKKFYRFGNYDDNFISLGLEQYICSFLCLRVGTKTSSIYNTDNIKYTYGLGLDIAMFSLSFAGQYYKQSDEYINKYILSLKVTI